MAQTCHTVQSWLQSRGGDSSKLELRSGTEGQRGVFAATPLKPGDAAFTIPQSVWLTAGALRATEAGRAALAWAASGKAGLCKESLEVCLLGLLLLLERGRASASEWAAHLAELPWAAAGGRLPLTWPPERLQEALRGAAPQRGLEAKRRELAAAYASLLPHCKRAGKAAHSQLARACASEGDFVAAFALALSRSLDVPTTDPDGRPWQKALLPVADMLGHSSEPELAWEVEAGGKSVVGRALREVAEGAELRIRYHRAGSAQASFAISGLVDEALAGCDELEPFWDGPGSDVSVHLSSPESVRRLLSCLRVAAASKEERRRLGGGPAAAAARVPISARCERGAMERLRAHLAKAPREGGEAPCGAASAAAPAALRLASQAGWERLDGLAASVLGELAGAGRERSAAELAALVHRLTRAATSPSARASAEERLDGGAVRAREPGGARGRGCVAAADAAAGALLLREEALVLDMAESDFFGLAAALAPGLPCEAAPTRGPPGPAEEAAMRWLRGVEGVTAEGVARALHVADEEGLRVALPGASETKPMLLFAKLRAFRHSCVPNCGVYREGTAVRVLALRPVKSGEELTIHYLDELQTLPTVLRRPFLKARFGFECDCERCEGSEKAEEACLVETALTRHAEGGLEVDAGRRQQEMQRALSTVFYMEQRGGSPVGFSPKPFGDWSAALVAVDAAMPGICACGAETHWARHQVRGLRCQALEGLGRDAAAFLALAEHAAAAWRLMPRRCDALRGLQERLELVRARLPAALAPRLEQRAQELHGAALGGLAEDVGTLRRWLAAAGSP